MTHSYFLIEKWRSHELLQVGQDESKQRSSLYVNVDLLEMMNIEAQTSLEKLMHSHALHARQGKPPAGQRSASVGTTAEYDLCDRYLGDPML